jgi:hypothetical protein
LRSVTICCCRYFAVSLPRRYDSSVPRRRALLAQAIAQALQLRAGLVDHLSRRIDLAPDVGDLPLERRGRFDDRGEARKRGAMAADAGDAGIDGREERTEAQQLQRFERASFDSKCAQDRIELGRRPQADLSRAR